MNKEDIKRAFTRSHITYNDHARIQRMMAERVGYLFKRYYNNQRPKTLEIGCGTGLLTEQLISIIEGNKLYINDLSDSLCRSTAKELAIDQDHCRIGDFETITITEKVDHIVSSSVFQWFIGIEETLVKIHNLLNENGVLLFSTFGSRNMNELYQVMGQPALEGKSLEAWTNLLEPHFEILHAEESEHILSFDSFMEILQHLKLTGVTGCNTNRDGWTRGLIQRMDKNYRDQFLFCGKYPLTYHPQYFVCRRK